MYLLKPALLLGLFAIAGSAVADDAWFVRAGAHNVDPKSDNGSLAGGTLEARIGSDVRPTLAIGRFLNDRWAVELLAALPFDHEVRLNGAKAADFKHLPPTLSLQHYFGEAGGFRPFLGAGLNYTWTFDQRETGPIAGTRLKIGNSVGAAAQAGFVTEITDTLHLVGEVRWVDIDASVSVNSTRVGTVEVDPLVYGLSLGWRF
jgi:outer membrane protein